jgi:hypothetical protein
MKVRPHILFAAVLCSVLGAAQSASAQTNAIVLDTFMETHRVENVGAGWETVSLVNSYTAPVVVCTYVLPSFASNEAHTRVRNVTPSQFEVRVQRFENSSAVTTSDVHCTVVDTGAHTLSNGTKIEAGTVLSDGTSGSAVGWGGTTMENITSSLTSGFGSIVVLGQVMTYNDPLASVFWTNNCSGRGTPPTSGSICVGKHIGMINGTRANETLGYIVLDPSTGTTNAVNYSFVIGADTIAGTANAAPYSYSVSQDYDTATLTQAAEDGGNGGWAVLFGTDPLPSGAIQLAIEEETVAGDSSRRHTQEQVFYAAYETNQTAILTANKTVTMSTDNETVYALPDHDVVYTIAFENTGTGVVDQNSLFLVDSVPDDLEFFNGDFDGAGPGTGSVAFSPGTSGLTFSPATDLAFSDAVAAPTTFAQCNYTPSAGYDPAVRHVCFTPKGYARPLSLYPGNTASLSFRMRIP